MILALLFRAFIDDSADRRQKVAVVAGAFVSSHREWGKFSINWKRLLKTHGIKYFRSTEYYGLSGEFAKFRDPVQFPSPKGREAATRVLTDLERLIQSSKLRE